MRILLGTLAALAIVATMAPAAARAKSNVGGVKSDLASEREIRELYDAFTAAWNKHDAPALGKMWALDGDHVEPDGTVAKGRDAVEKLLVAQHQGVFKQTKLGLTVETVWFITADVALVDGTYEILGIRAPDGKELPKRSGRLTSVLLREGGRWWIVASRLMIPTELPYKKK